MVCRDFILPEPASYVFFYAIFNLRNLLYIILPSFINLFASSISSFISTIYTFSFSSHSSRVWA